MLLHVRLSVGLGGAREQEEANRQFKSSAAKSFREAAFIQEERWKPEQPSAEP